MAYIYGTTSYAKNYLGNYIINYGKYVYEIRLGYQVNSQNIELNKSNISLRLEVRSTNSNFKTYGYNQQTTIDGTSLGSQTFDFRSTNVWQIFGTKTFDVTHNEDGTYSAIKEGYFTTNATGEGRPYSGNASVNVTLPTIPRASSITVNDANIGSATNIVINKTSSNFTTTLYYKASGQNSWTKIVDKTSNQVYGWTVPTSFYALIPNSKNITCQFYAETYNGDTLVGTSQTVTALFTATGNPVINSFTVIDIDEITVDLTGDNTKMIKGASTISATVSASGQNSANISSIKVNEVTAVNNIVEFIKPITNTFEVIIIDTRGYSTSQTITMPMVNYIPLTINANISRNTPTDEKINISFSGNYFNDSFGAQNNTLTVQYRYKESTSSTWGNWTTISNTKNGNTYSGYVQLSNMDYQKVYNFEMRATDKTGTKPVNGITVSKGEPVYWWDEDEFHLNSKLYYGSNGRQDYAAYGFIYDGAGNMKHKRSDQNDYFNIKSYNDTMKLQFFPETGLLNVMGNIQKNGSNVALASDVPTKLSDLTNDTADFMVVMNNATQTIKGNNTNVKYNLNTVKTSNGSKLTFDSNNHGVNIGSGVSYVEVSAMVYVFTRGASSNNVLYIYKNDTQVARYNHGISGDYESMVIPSIIIPVQQNDKIYVYIRSSAGTNTNVVFGGNPEGVNYLTVKVIK